ncbi:hypothetical protein SRABI83_04051 [Arthrobacter sp. Bi83]|nr:hypothetical protein SRABI83_04051 [Arthrobacter sp. Bi83]
MSSWTLLISGACTRHAYKPLFENLPACTREGDKFRVFPRLFDLNHRKFGGFASNCALSGLSPAYLSEHKVSANIKHDAAGKGAPPSLTSRTPHCDALSLPAGKSPTLSHFLRESHRRSLTSCGKVTDAPSLPGGKSRTLPHFPQESHRRFFMLSGSTAACWPGCPGRPWWGERALPRKLQEVRGRGRRGCRK